MGDAKNTKAIIVNLILYKRCQVWFMLKDHKKRKSDNSGWNTLHRELCSFRHHNATKDETVFLSFTFSFLLDSQNPQDGGMMVLRNNGNHIQNYIISKPRSP
jgi:hexokinase